MFIRGFIVHNISKLFVKHMHRCSQHIVSVGGVYGFKEERNDILNTLYKVCLALLIVGGLNWGLIGLLDFDLVAWLFGSPEAILSRIVYTLVGVGAAWGITLLFRPREERGA